MCNVTLWRFRVTIFAVEKQQLLHILCVCVFVALGIRHSMLMRRIISSSEVCPALKYFVLHYLKNRTIFGNMYSTQNSCFDFPYNLSENFLIVIITERDIIVNVRRSSRTVPVLWGGGRF